MTRGDGARPAAAGSSGAPVTPAPLRLIDGAEITGRHDAAADVVIVGSGPGGAAVARELARAGASVLVVEEGPFVPPERFAPDAFTAMATLFRDLGAQVAIGRGALPLIQGRVVGGTSVVNGAISWRFPREVLDEWVRADPPLAEALPWDELDRASHEMERLLHVQPTDPAIAGPHNLLLARGAEALGLEHGPIRRNVSGCRGLGRCMQGCPEGHKLSVERSLLPEACAHGARILSSTRVDRIVVERGRATGVEATAAGGGRVRARARRAVVVAGGAIQSPLLLQRSGLGGSGPVGEHLQCHPGAAAGGEFPEAVTMWTGATQGHEVTGLRAEGIKIDALGYDLPMVAMRLDGVGRDLASAVARMDRVAFWAVAVRAEAHGRVRATPLGALVRWSPTEADMRRMRRGLRVTGELLLAAGATAVHPGIHGFDPRVTDRARLAALEASGPLDPRAYSMIATHLFGTCRLASDRRAGVVRPDFRHHTIEGLHVADASVFPTTTGVNPMTSILALATVAGRRLVGATRV